VGVRPVEGSRRLNAAEYVLWDLWIADYSARRDGFVVDSRRTVTDELTPYVCAEAQRGGHAVSGFLAARWEDGTFRTTVGAIDVDTDADDAVAIRGTLAAHGIPTLMAMSRRGAHLWMWTRGDGTNRSEKYMPVPAGRVRNGLQAAVDLTIADPDRRSHIEVFPKRGSSAPNSMGALRMPLFKHPKTGIVYPVVHTDGRTTFERATAYSWAIEVGDSPYNALCALTGRAPTSVAYPRDFGRQRRPSPPTEGAGVVSLLAQMGLTEAKPGRNVRCPFHQDKHASMSVAADDQRVWCQAPTCPAYNGGRGLGSLALAKAVSTRK